MDSADLLFYPTRHTDGFPAPRTAVEYAGGRSAVEKAVDELGDVFAIDGDVVRYAAFILIALDIE